MLIVCQLQSEGAFVVIDTKSILSVVAMVPFTYATDSPEGYYFMIEQIGLDVVDADYEEDEQTWE